MKYIILSMLLTGVVLEAKPCGCGGFGGLGAALGLGGYNRGHSGYTEGGQFDNNLLNAGSNGIGSQNFLSQGGRGYHNRGQHQSKVTSINQAEQSDAHDIGGSQTFNTGAEAGNAFNSYLNKANVYGNQFVAQGGASQQGIMT